LIESSHRRLHLLIFVGEYDLLLMGLESLPFRWIDCWWPII